MKTITHLVILTIIGLGATAFIAHKSKPAASTHTAVINPVWFNTIQIADGITVEFEYGSQLQVFVEGDKELITQLAVVLENNVLKATGKNNLVPVKDIRIKVVTPVLISLKRQTEYTPGNDIHNSIGKTSSTEVIVQPVLKQQKLFQVYTVPA